MAWRLWKTRDQHCLLPRPAQNEIVAVAILAFPMVLRYERAIESGKGDDRRPSDGNQVDQFHYPKCRLAASGARCIFEWGRCRLAGESQRRFGTILIGQTGALTMQSAYYGRFGRPRAINTTQPASADA